MLQECQKSGCQRKFSMENLRKESAIKAAKRLYKCTLKALLKDFNIPSKSWEQSERIGSNNVALPQQQRSSVAPDFVHLPILSKLNKSGWGSNHFCSYAKMDKNG